MLVLLATTAAASESPVDEDEIKTAEAETATEGSTTDGLRDKRQFGPLLGQLLGGGYGTYYVTIIQMMDI